MIITCIIINNVFKHLMKNTVFLHCLLADCMGREKKSSSRYLHMVKDVVVTRSVRQHCSSVEWTESTIWNPVIYSTCHNDKQCVV